MNRSLRIAVADDECVMREYLQGLLTRLGHRVEAAEDGRQLVELCRAAAPDLIITGIKMPDLDGLVAAGEVNKEREVPVILVSAHHDAELRARARQGTVMAYLVKPVKQADLESAIDLAMTRFEQFQAVRQEAATLRQALEDRKVLERAKGVVEKRMDVDEQEAFRRMKRLASTENRKLSEVAQKVLAAEDVFRLLHQG
jgi:response regulator NasT